MMRTMRRRRRRACDREVTHGDSCMRTDSGNTNRGTQGWEMNVMAQYLGLSSGGRANEAEKEGEKG